MYCCIFLGINTHVLLYAMCCTLSRDKDKHPQTDIPSLSRQPPKQTAPSRDGHCSGWYAFDFGQYYSCLCLTVIEKKEVFLILKFIYTDSKSLNHSSAGNNEALSLITKYVWMGFSPKDCNDSHIAASLHKRVKPSSVRELHYISDGNFSFVVKV